MYELNICAWVVIDTCRENYTCYQIDNDNKMFYAPIL